ncbi:MAG: succinate dehydrogenase assembly factor 2 [Rudaea sp.]
MSTAESANESRLRWHCRRGMRELDQLLGWYLDTRYPHAGTAQKAAFVSLLEAQDPDLWTWLGGRDKPRNPAWCAIIDEIRTRHSV